jgi:sugar phosphate isomerase/epimerase
MAKLAINEMTTFRWSFEEDVRHYLAAGISAIGVWRQKLSDFGEAKGAELLADSGMTVSSLQWAGGFTGSDGRGFRDSVADGCDAVRTAAELRAGCLVVHSGSRGGHTRNHARRLLRGALNDMIAVADDLDVTLAIEPMHFQCGADWTFLSTAEETLELLDAAGANRVKLVFDTYHLCQQDQPTTAIESLAPRVAIVQLGDSRCPPVGEQNRCPLGEGQLPLADVISQLTSAGYDGFFEVELIGEDVEAMDYQTLIEGSKAAFEKIAA